MLYVAFSGSRMDCRMDSRMGAECPGKMSILLLPSTSAHSTAILYTIYCWSRRHVGVDAYAHEES